MRIRIEHQKQQSRKQIEADAAAGTAGNYGRHVKLFSSSFSNDMLERGEHACQACGGIGIVADQYLVILVILIVTLRALYLKHSAFKDDINAESFLPVSDLSGLYGCPSPRYVPLAAAVDSCRLR